MIPSVVLTMERNVAELAADPTAEMKKLIIIGDGGLGKTTLMINLAEMQESHKLRVGHTGAEGTTQVQAVFMPETDTPAVMLIDTPNRHMNEDLWFRDLLKVGKVNAVILFVQQQMRDSSYGQLMFIYEYLTVNKLPFMLFWRGPEGEDFGILRGHPNVSVLRTESGVGSVRTFIAGLQPGLSFQLQNNIQLLKQLRNVESHNAELVSNNQQLVQEILRLEIVERTLEDTNEELQARVDMLSAMDPESLFDLCQALTKTAKMYAELPTQLAAEDTRNGGLKAANPKKRWGVVAALPFAGSVWFSRLCEKGEADLAVAKTIDAANKLIDMAIATREERLRQSITSVTAVSAVAAVGEVVQAVAAVRDSEQATQSPMSAAV